jgi:hypothetical protein
MYFIEFSENDLDHVGVPMKELCTSVNAGKFVLIYYY